MQLPLQSQSRQIPVPAMATTEIIPKHNQQTNNSTKALLFIVGSLLILRSYIRGLREGIMFFRKTILIQ
jgi:hypothetical protein